MVMVDECVAFWRLGRYHLWDFLSFVNVSSMHQSDQAHYPFRVYSGVRGSSCAFVHCGSLRITIIEFQCEMCRFFSRKSSKVTTMALSTSIKQGALPQHQRTSIFGRCLSVILSESRTPTSRVQASRPTSPLVITCGISPPSDAPKETHVLP